jgi:polyphenol oxidase
MTIKPSVFETFTTISAGQSTRKGGISKVPFLSLNLGKSVGDELGNVEHNRQIFLNSLGFEVSNAVFSHQVHGSEILLVQEAGNFSGFDAQITNKKGVCLAVSVADCTPILVFDAENQAVAAIHAGWKGTVNQIVAKTMAEMNKNFGTVGKNCFAYIGACISKENFEVNADVANHFEEEFKTFDTEKQKYFVDLKATNKAQLVDFGIPENQIEVTDYCTVSNNDLFFSHRKEKGNTGRMLAAIGLK